MTEQDKQPWYKQFWPWFLISIPLASIIGGISMIIISIDGADTLVKEDYYKEGLAINKQFDKLRRAKSLGIKAELTLTDNKFMLNLNSEQPITESLTLEFSHATIKSKDFSLSLQQTTNGQYFSYLTPEQLTAINGKWYITLYPYSEQWHLKNHWRLPTKTALLLGQ